ncbi:CHAD domain-containing protein [Marinobacterium jannaschii]|uniref:CHAD domain-containing protein n=1 Tax=Marinobacterium jannaschii TaxID=64970 RepID=UPI000484468B|nr:CHAD domain-containing protein [Marinobacterium jannaschii]
MAINYMVPDPAENLRAAFRREIRDLKRLLRGPAAEEDLVHQVRVSGKRFRAMLYLLRPALGGRCYRTELKRVRAVMRQLGATRDRDVRISTLGSLLLGQAEPGLITRLTDGLRQSAQPLITVPAPGRITMQAKPLLSLKKRSRLWKIKALRVNLLRRQLQQQYRRGRRLWKRLQKGQDESLLHDWRTEAKGFYLQLNCLLDGRERKGYRARLKQLSEVLGQLHDLHMLRDWIAGNRRWFYQDDLNQLHRLIRQREAELLQTIWPLAAEIYRRKATVCISALLQR